ncbi:MAG: hypothetical protein LBP24_02620 [Coriobacteriales bacterium]|nr:hypothetical protein [Coriobacteriales bacterium]
MRRDIDALRQAAAAGQHAEISQDTAQLIETALNRVRTPDPVLSRDLGALRAALAAGAEPVRVLISIQTAELLSKAFPDDDTPKADADGTVRVPFASKPRAAGALVFNLTMLIGVLAGFAWMLTVEPPWYAEFYRDADIMAPISLGFLALVITLCCVGGAIGALERLRTSGDVGFEIGPDGIRVNYSKAGQSSDLISWQDVVEVKRHLVGPGGRKRDYGSLEHWSSAELHFQRTHPHAQRGQLSLESSLLNITPPQFRVLVDEHVKRYAPQAFSQDDS